MVNFLAQLLRQPVAVLYLRLDSAWWSLAVVIVFVVLVVVIGLLLLLRHACGCALRVSQALSVFGHLAKGTHHAVEVCRAVPDEQVHNLDVPHCMSPESFEAGHRLASLLGSRQARLDVLGALVALLPWEVLEPARPKNVVGECGQLPGQDVIVRHVRHHHQHPPASVEDSAMDFHSACLRKHPPTTVPHLHDCVLWQDFGLLILLPLLLTGFSSPALSCRGTGWQDFLARRGLLLLLLPPPLACCGRCSRLRS